MPDKKKKEKEMKLFRNKTEKFGMFLFQKIYIYLIFFVELSSVDFSSWEFSLLGYYL